MREGSARQESKSTRREDGLIELQTMHHRAWWQQVLGCNVGEAKIWANGRMMGAIG